MGQTLRRFWFLLTLGVVLLVAASSTVVAAGAGRLLFGDDTGRTPGDVIQVYGIAGDADVPNPPGLAVQSAISNRGAILWLVKNGTPGQDSDIGVIVLGQGSPYVAAPASYLEFGYNYGLDGKPQFGIIGELVERGGVGVDIRLQANGRTNLMLRKDGTVEVFNALRAVNDGGRFLVEMGLQGLRIMVDGQWKVVEVGAPDSGGPGRRALTVAN